MVMASQGVTAFWNAIIFFENDTEKGGWAGGGAGVLFYHSALPCLKFQAAEMLSSISDGGSNQLNHSDIICKRANKL